MTNNSVLQEEITKEDSARIKAESSFGKRISLSVRVKEKIFEYFFALNETVALIFIILIFIFFFK